MGTVELKSNLHQLIDGIQDSKALKVIYTLLSKLNTKDVYWWDELTSEQKAEIEEFIAEADRGELIPHEEVMKKYKKWL